MKNAARESIIRRARPQLGTIVEIAVVSPDETTALQAVHAALETVSQVERLMSFHSDASEVSFLNTEAHLTPVVVHEWTYAVLATAQQLSRESHGAFDVTIAPELAAWDYLPRRASYHETRSGRWQDIQLLADRRVSFRRPLQIDLGGIAKGYAVHCAVETLRQSGIAAGLVNAGGDLRAFGQLEWPVQIRHPRDPLKTGHAFSLSDAAVATSASYFSRRRWNEEWVSPLLEGNSRQPRIEECSVSVQAPTAMLADALTKVVMTARDQAAEILQRHRASALILDRFGEPDFVGVQPAPEPVRPSLPLLR